MADGLGHPTEEYSARCAQAIRRAVRGRYAQGRLTALERALLDKPWQQARPQVRVKMLAQDAELYVFAESRDRIAKERACADMQILSFGIDLAPWGKSPQDYAVRFPINLQPPPQSPRS